MKFQSGRVEKRSPIFQETNYLLENILIMKTIGFIIPVLFWQAFYGLYLTVLGMYRIVNPLRRTTERKTKNVVILLGKNR